ncbi:hypothetical protein RRG08_044568 [Elysia crispata]|uniref:Uncharacterized protein n=1 Tax=Elysia crispata TaxID=231223 RepID=A0AAE1ACC4_9GAST|nr:hypothetical protein RRG08_044568 [Elysia crispata]
MKYPRAKPSFEAGKRSPCQKKNAEGHKAYLPPRPGGPSHSSPKGPTGRVLCKDPFLVKRINPLSPEGASGKRPAVTGGNTLSGEGLIWSLRPFVGYRPEARGNPPKPLRNPCTKAYQLRGPFP